MLVVAVVQLESMDIDGRFVVNTVDDEAVRSMCVVQAGRKLPPYNPPPPAPPAAAAAAPAPAEEEQEVDLFGPTLQQVRWGRHSSSPADR